MKSLLQVLMKPGSSTSAAASAARRSSGRGSNMVPSLPEPTLGNAAWCPKLAPTHVFVLQNPRSTGQEGFET